MSQYRAKRPPLPKQNSKQPQGEEQTDQSRRIGKIRENRAGKEYNTDTDLPKESRIPRLSGSDKMPEPKKYISETEYENPNDKYDNSKPNVRRSHSFLQNRSRAVEKTDEDIESIKNYRKTSGSAVKASYLSIVFYLIHCKYKSLIAEQCCSVDPKKHLFLFRVKSKRIATAEDQLITNRTH